MVLLSLQQLLLLEVFLDFVDPLGETLEVVLVADGCVERLCLCLLSKVGDRRLLIRLQISVLVVKCFQDGGNDLLHQMTAMIAMQLLLPVFVG